MKPFVVEFHYNGDEILGRSRMFYMSLFEDKVEAVTLPEEKKHEHHHEHIPKAKLKIKPKPKPIIVPLLHS